MEINEFISQLKQSFEQAVVFHHQTNCLSEHEALRDYYEEIIPLLDGLIESLQGVYPRIGGFTLVNPVDWSYGISTAYFQGLYKFVQEKRKMVCQESWAQNEIDSIVKLIASTLYKLSLNK